MDDKQAEKPIPAPRKNVKEMVKQYEDKIIKPIPTVSTKKLAQISKPRSDYLF